MFDQRASRRLGAVHHGQDVAQQVLAPRERGEGGAGHLLDGLVCLTGCGALGGDEGGWKAMQLLDDNSDPDNPGWHEGRSLVTGVRFTSLADDVLPA